MGPGCCAGRKALEGPGLCAVWRPAKGAGGGDGPRWGALESGAPAAPEWVRLKAAGSLYLEAAGSEPAARNFGSAPSAAFLAPSAPSLSLNRVPHSAYTP